MTQIIDGLKSPKQRRQALTIISAILILSGLVADNLLGMKALQDSLMTLAALIAGSDIAIRAWRSLLNRHVSIELLVTIAASGAILIGEYWEAAAVTFLFILGAYLEARTLSRTRQVLGRLLDLAPNRAIVIRNGRQVEVLLNEIHPGETVLMKPGSKIGVDGEVLTGFSAVDESAITGEPMPVEKHPGAQVFAGSVNQNGMLTVRATGVGADTTLARIIRRVEEAQEEKAPTQRFIERFARWYTPFIIALSVVVYLVTRDIELSLTLLVIGCPGALVISTPVSVVAGIGRAAKAGILIKGGEYLENAGKITAIALDKTGTLTQGKPKVTEIISLQPALVPAGFSREPDQMAAQLVHSPVSEKWNQDQAEVLHWAAIAESGSEHPLARAILEEDSSIGLSNALANPDDLPHPDQFESRPGMGVTASYQGRTIVVGTEELVDELQIDLDLTTRDHLRNLRSAGKTAVLVTLDNQLLGIIGISDSIRDDSKRMIESLNDIGLGRIAMLTGDDHQTAQNIAESAGIQELYADLMPEDKFAIIRQMQAEGNIVAMTGDGINDAPALAAADIGIAMGAAGTDVAIETADIALMSDDLMKIPEALRISKATLRNIHQNVFIALATVTALLLGVLLGEVHMAGGMLIHEASVLIVILNGMRLLRA
ncbi:MAG: cation-translocating P-type ATPase [Anaerolineales bacterium]